MRTQYVVTDEFATDFVAANPMRVTTTKLDHARIFDNYLDAQARATAEGGSVAQLVESPYLDAPMRVVLV